MSYFNKLLESAMMTDLQKEISEARKSVHTDGYPMSIGELVNLYDDGEIDIRPEFQRLFRWKSDQKVNLLNLFYWVFLSHLFLFLKEMMEYGR